MALMCYEAQEEHDPEHSDEITEVLGNLQQQLNVGVCFFFLRHPFKQNANLI